MNLYLVFIIICMLLGVKIYFKNFNKEYMSKTSTECIKGIFILIVFFSHAVAYMLFQNYDNDMLMFNVRNYLGQLMVTMFLFYSGYGIYESIKNKKDYIKSIPVNRILKTLFHFDIVILCYALVRYIIGIPATISDVLYAFTGWIGIGNSNWYIFAILVLYFATYIAFTLFKDKHINAIVLISIFTIMIMASISAFKGPGFDYCFNTLMCFPFGLFYSYYKIDIEKILFNNKNYILTLITCLIFFISIKRISDTNIIWYSIICLLFVSIIILLTMKINFRSKILNWFGKNLFWVYILQRIPMIVMNYYKYSQTNPYLFFGLSFVITIILSLVFAILFKKIDKLLFSTNSVTGLKK